MPTKDFSQLLKDCLNNDPAALCLLRYRLSHPEQEKAKKILYAIEHADSTYPQALALLGLIEKKNKAYQAAADFFNQAIELGNNFAKTQMARIYRDRGDDYSKAKALLEQAVAQGDSFAMYELACMYRWDIKSGPLDLEKTIALYEQAAEQKNSIAMYELGEIYYYRNDNSKAKNYIQQAAQLGSHKALYLLAKLYEDGRIDKPNQQKALSLYIEAASLTTKDEGELFYHLHEKLMVPPQELVSIINKEPDVAKRIQLLQGCLDENTVLGKRLAGMKHFPIRQAIKGYLRNLTPTQINWKFWEVLVQPETSQRPHREQLNELPEHVLK